MTVATVTEIQLEKITADPSKYFQAPMQVVHDDGLSVEQKVQILDAWDHLARELAVASEEGMVGGEPSRQAEVAEARAALGVIREERAASPTKHA
jgi:hypothetical protein